MGNGRCVSQECVCVSVCVHVGVKLMKHVGTEWQILKIRVLWHYYGLWPTSRIRILACHLRPLPSVSMSCLIYLAVHGQDADVLSLESILRQL